MPLLLPLAVLRRSQHCVRRSIPSSSCQDTMKRASVVSLVMGLSVVEAYLLPLDPKAFFSSRGRELQNRADRVKRAAQRDVVAEVDLVDVRLAGWRLKLDESVNGGDGAATEPSQMDEAIADTEPRIGDVVEFPLKEHVIDLEGGARDKGVGVLLSMNRDRLDADILPEHLRNLCEVGVLTLDLDAMDGDKPQLWMKDELETNVYIAYGDLKKVRSSVNDGLDKWRRWKLEESLSEGCGAPVGAEEVDLIL